MKIVKKAKIKMIRAAIHIKSVVITQKFHVELAREGIEYSWAVTKGVY
jgi:hypothetical protein